MGVATASIGARPLSARRPATPLLAALLLAATGWAVLAGGWTDSAPGVLLVGLAGVLEGAVLARLRVPRLLALLAAPVLLFVSLLPTNAGSRPLGAVTGFGHLVAQYAGAAFSGLLGNASWEFNVSLGALLWVCGAWAAWFALRERRGAVATGPCWAVIAVTVINAPSPGAVTLPAALTAAAALMLIAAVHLDRLNDSWRQRRVSVLPGTGGRFATAALIGGAFIVLLAQVIPPLSSTDISGRLFGGGNTASGSGSGRGATGSGSGSGVTVRFSNATIPGGALRLSSSQVLTYHTSISAGVYLRMATDSVFDSGNFLPAASTNLNGDDAQEVVSAGTIPRDRSVSDGGVGAQQQTVSLTATMIDDTSDTNTLPFGGEPDASSVGVRVDGLTRPEANGQLLTVDTVESIRQVLGTTFTTTATQSTAVAAQLRQAGTEYPPFISRNFLDLHEDTTGGAAAIRALAKQWTATATTPYDKAATIETMLRNPQLFHYTLNPAQPPVGGMWPLTYFLTVTHSGYCQYFAAAMGAMLRAVGIPARLINGYGPGSAPRSEAASRGTLNETAWTVSSNDAHTWVEAYFPGYGWIPFEPTPSSVAGAYQPFTRGPIGTTRSVPSSGGPLATPSPKPAPRDVATPTSPNSPRSSGGRGLLVGLAAGAAAVILVIALFATWFLRPRNVRGVWRRVGIIGRLLGVRRDRALTFDEYVDRLSAALPTDSRASGGVHSDAEKPPWPVRLADALRDIATISDRTFYSPPSSRSDELTRLRSAWRRAAILAPHLGRGRGAEPAG